MQSENPQVAFVFINKEESVEFNPTENSPYTDKEILVEPVTEKFVKIVTLNTENEVYTPAKNRVVFIVMDLL